MTTAAQAAREVAVVTKDELSELATWEKKHADAKKKVAESEKQLDFLRIRLAEKVLGVKTADELKRLAPDQVEKRMRRRLADGDWKPERGAPEFSFVQSSKGRYPAWAQLYAEELGETAANQVRSNTPTTYSYAVDVVVPA